MGIEFKAPSKPSLIYIFCSGALEVLDRVENTLEQQFNCLICIALPIHPIFLNCGHHNCWLCLFQWKEANQPSICPLCRYRFTLALKSTGTVYTLKPESCTTETNAANIVSVSLVHFQILVPTRAIWICEEMNICFLLKTGTKRNN